MPMPHIMLTEKDTSLDPLRDKTVAIIGCGSQGHAHALKEADIIILLAPDTKQPQIYEHDILPHLAPGKSLAFAHGFNIHYKTIIPPKNIDVWMVAPKGPGHLVR